MRLELSEYKIHKNNMCISEKGNLVYVFDNIMMLIKDEINLSFNERFYNLYAISGEECLFKISIPYEETSLHNIALLISDNQLLLIINYKDENIKYSLIDLDNSETRYLEVNSKSKKSIEHFIWIHNFKQFKRIW